MLPNDLLDQKYYKAAPSGSLSERLVIAARDRIYADFLLACAPEAQDRILDVGVSDVVNDAANMLERKYPHPERITALGLGAGHAFQAAFPAVGYVRHGANQPLPFADGAFDIAACNAVLEHVGTPANQTFLLRELVRIARKIFVSVPNRYFPVEHHTAIPLLQVYDATFAVTCRLLGKGEWADQRNLILMSKRKLVALIPQGVKARVGYTGLRMGPMSSNLFIFIERDAI